MRVLVADDEIVSRSLMEAMLVENGYDVTAVGSGEEALAHVRTGEYRLLLLDWKMPGLDGVHVCREIRKAELAGYVYIIMVTASDDTESVVHALESGADDYVRKPFNSAELRARVRAGERVVALETRDMAIFAMAKLAESRDPETGAHLERVRCYCRELAQCLADRGLLGDDNPGEYVRLVYLTSPLHDIGKVGIPDCVLLKPGRLNDREYEIMKSHAALGADTLDAAAKMYPGTKFLTMARDIALTHHERFDGTGYPRGLAGTAIPLSGRITAVADVYDALTSVRVYKPAMTHDVARSMIVGDAGTHFDPMVVDAFVACEAAFQRIREEFSEAVAIAA